MHVYILASDREGRLYVGAARLIYGHPNDLVEGFTKRHGFHKLVWFERHRDIKEAILSEKRLKRWNRQWKLRLIEEVTPDWIDLFDQTMS